MSELTDEYWTRRFEIGRLPAADRRRARGLFDLASGPGKLRAVRDRGRGAGGRVSAGEEAGREEGVEEGERLTWRPHPQHNPNGYQKGHFMKLHHLGITLCALLALSCRGSASNQATNATPAPTATAEEEWQAPIEKIGASEIYPTADGGAYVITPNGRLWYVKEQRAYRVSEATGQPARIGANISDRAAGFALLSAERQRSRKLEEALKSAKFEISELKEAQ